jgi:hypothetical protein
MAKRQSASSQRAKLVSVSAAALRRKPLSKKQKNRLARLAALPDSEIDFSDIAELSAEQLQRQPAKELVSMRLDCPSRKPRQPVESMTLLNLSNVSEANVTPRYMSTEGVAFGFLTVREPLREQKKEALRKLGDAA